MDCPDQNLGGKCAASKIPDPKNISFYHSISDTTFDFVFGSDKNNDITL